MNTSFIGQHIIRLNSVDSTNNYTSNLLRHTVMPEGSIVITSEQTAGRGRRGRTWQSKIGENLTFSLLLKPVFLAPSGQFSLAEAISLGIADGIEELTGKICKLKWPNDILLQGGKVSGILIESSFQGERTQHAIAGIGININQKRFPTDISNAVSISTISGRKYDLDYCLERFCHSIEQRYLQLKSRRDIIHTAYINHLYLLHEWADFIIDGEKRHVRIIDVECDGSILMETESYRMKLSMINRLDYPALSH